MKKLTGFVAIAVVMLAGILSGCGAASPSNQTIQTLPTLSPTEIVDLNIVTGQLVFVPAYSEVISISGPPLKLSATLAIHNTDPNNTIIVKSVRYYNTDGDLVREFIDSPTQLKPLATTGFVIRSEEGEGGWGANFLVEWGAEIPVYEPVIEAIMVSSRGTEGVSFISVGRVVSEQRP